METQSLLQIDSYEDAAALLAKRAVAGQQMRMEKMAQGSDPVGAALEWIKQKPMVSYPLIGAMGGAALGGLMNFGKRKEDRTWLPSMATGAIAGGGLGLGAGLLSTDPRNWKVPESLRKLQEGWRNYWQGSEAPAASPSSPEAAGDALQQGVTGPWLSGQQVWDNLVELGKMTGKFGPNFDNLPQATQEAMVQEFAAELQGQNLSAGGFARSFQENIPRGMGTFAGVAGIEAAKQLPGTLPSGEALRLGVHQMAGQGEKGLLDPKFVSEARKFTMGDWRRGAWRASGWNPMRWFSNKPVFRVTPSVPAASSPRGLIVPNGPGSMKVPTFAAAYAKALKKPTPPPQPVELSRPVARTAMALGRGKPGLGSKIWKGTGTGLQALWIATYLWNLVSKARTMHDPAAAKEAIGIYRSWNMPDDQIRHILGDDMFRIAAGG